ncbi:MAG: tetratricopeptide repeat protein [Desulfuromonadaceae bacterium]|nr:tetratricopeptide repeat protein [Desulfuromonadaceae bacterium]
MDRVFLPFLALVLLLTPLSGYWSVGWLGGVLVLMPLVALCIWLWKRRYDSAPFSSPPGSAALLFLIGWGTVQLLPLPLFLVKYLSPHSWKIYHQSVEVLSPSIWVPLSLNPQSTLQAVLVLCAGTACYFLVVFLLKDQAYLKHGVLWLIGISGGLAMGVILLRLTSLFLPKVFSPNHKLAAILTLDLSPIALLMLMLGPLGLAVLLALRPISRYGSWQERVSTYWKATVQDHFLIIALSALVVPFSIGVLYWHVLLFYLGALALLGVLVTLKRKGLRDSAYLLFFTVVALAALVIGLYGRTTPQKPIQMASVSKADNAIVSTLTNNYWFTGSGLGTYSKVYRRIGRQVTNPVGLVAPPLQQGRVEGGLPFIVGIVWFVCALLRHAWPRWRKRRNKMAIYFFAGSLSGLTAFAWAVITLRVPVPPWLWYYVFVLAGMMVAASQVEHHKTFDRDCAPVRSDWRLPMGRLLCAFVLLIAVFVQGGRGLSKGFFAQAQVSSQETSPNASRNDTQKRLLSHAVFYDPLNAPYRWALGWSLLQLGQTEKAMTSFSRALRLNPLVGMEAYRLGIYLADIGQGGLAIKLMHSGLQNDWENQSLQVDLVERLLNHGGQTEALEHVRKILVQDPSKTLDWLYFFDQQGFSISHEGLLLADHPRCFADYGDFLFQKDLPEQALDAYNSALYFIQTEESFQPEVVWRLSAFFESRQLYEEALSAVLAGGRVYPKNLDIMKATGNFYERLGITFKAAEIYRQILMHNPHDPDIRQRLKLLQN